MSLDDIEGLLKEPGVDGVKVACAGCGKHRLTDSAYSASAFLKFGHRTCGTKPTIIAIRLGGQ